MSPTLGAKTKARRGWGTRKRVGQETHATAGREAGATTAPAAGATIAPADGAVRRFFLRSADLLPLGGALPKMLSSCGMKDDDAVE